MDIQSINIPELIKTGQYYQHKSTIKNYEDTLQKLLSNGKNTEITNQPHSFIWKLDKELFPDFNNKILTMGFEIFGEAFEKLGDNIVITGPLVRSCLINTTDVNYTDVNSKSKGKIVNLINELYFFRCGDEEWDEIFDINIFSDKKTEYIYESNGIKITLVKKRFKHSAHVILQHDYLKRVGYCGGEIYGSSMFLLEIQKHFTLINSKFKDPILNIPYDPLKIYNIDNSDNLNPIKIIDSVDIEELSKLSKKSLTKLYSGKTCLELCLDKLVKLNHPVLISQLKQMIAYLGSNSKPKRPPYLYAKLLKIDTSYPEIYTYLKSIDSVYDIKDILSEFKSLDDINLLICDELALNDNVDEFLDFVSYSKLKINKNLINILVKNGSDRILEQIAKNIAKKNLDNNCLSDNYLLYYLIFMSENFNLIDLIGEINLDLAMNYLLDILEGGKIRSFYYLYEQDNSILGTLFESNKNLLHMVKINKLNVSNSINLIELIIKLKPELLNMKDLNKETPVVHQSKICPEIIKIFLEYEFDYTITDAEGNCFIHYLCMIDCPDILKLSLKRCPELIDMPNKRSETPLILCGINNLENMFYVLKGAGADVFAQDLYGNTVLHYICSNSMCLGMIIENKQNYFGLKPSDYCKVSEKYYNFINSI